MNVITDEDEREKQLLLAMKCTAGEEPIPKQSRQDNRSRMPIDNLLNPEPARVKDKTWSKGKSKIKGKTRKARSKRQAFHADRTYRYDVVSAFMNGKFGLKFGQLLQGDANSARKELQRILGKAKLKLVVLEEYIDRNSDNEESCLAVPAVRTYGVELYALLDTGAILNVMSPQVVRKLSLKPEKISKVVTVAPGDKSSAIGKLSNVPLLFGNLQDEVDFIVLENIPFDIIIGRPTIKRLGGVLYFKAEEVRMNYQGHKAIIPMLCEFSKRLELVEETDSEDFTSDSSSERSAAENNRSHEASDEEELFLTIQGNDDSPIEGKKLDINAELKKKPKHWPSSSAEVILDTLLNTGVMVHSLHDLRPEMCQFGTRST